MESPGYNSKFGTFDGGYEPVNPNHNQNNGNDFSSYK